MSLTSPLLLPDSRTRHVKRVFRAGAPWVQTYCASCAVPGVLVPEEHTTCVTYFCDDCAVKFQEQTKVMLVPDELFFQMVVAEELDKHKRVLTETERAEALKDEHSTHSKLKRDRDHMDLTKG